MDEECTHNLDGCHAAPAARALDIDSIYRAHVRPLYVFIYGKVGNQQAAEDITADVFVSANQAQLTRVAELVGAPKTLAHNRLVVAVPKDDTRVAALADLAKPGVKVVVAASSVPVGAYARQGKRRNRE